MEKQRKARRAPNIAVVAMVVIATCVGIAVFTVRALDRQRRTSFTVANQDTDIPIAASGDRLQDWADAARQAAASYIDGLDLVRAYCIVHDGTFESVTFDYYRYIDDSREGGNIRNVTLYIDAASGSIHSIHTYEGACGEGIGANGYETDAPVPADVLQRRAPDIEAMAVASTGQPLDPSSIVNWLYRQDNGVAIDNVFADPPIDREDLPSIDDIPEVRIR